MAAFLLDTCAVLWALLDRHELSSKAEEIIRDAKPLYLSSVSVWEIANKYNLGKLPHAASVAEDVVAVCARLKVETLPLSLEDAQMAGLLPFHHRDPFDRMLAAQAKRMKVPVITNDLAFKPYGVKTVW